MTEFMLQHIQVSKDIAMKEQYTFIFSVEEVNQMVREGVPFREAYQKVGKEIKDGSFNPSREIAHSHEGSIGNLCNVEIQKKFKTAFNA
jgi:argininosuccinate lyase